MTKEDGAYETEDPSCGGVFNHNHCSHAAVLSAGSCTQQLSDQVLHQGVRTYGAGGSVLRQFHADI